MTLTRCSPVDVLLCYSQGTAHFVFSWPDTKRQCSVDIVQVKKVTHATYTGDDSGNWVPLVAFECRGCVPVAYYPRDEWRVTSSGGTVFEDVDLSDKEWAEVCEKTSDPVQVMEFAWKFDAHK